MINLLEFFFWYASIAVTSGFCGLWLWFIVKRPQQWAGWVDMENDFFLEIGLYTTAMAECFKRWEKGRPLKFILGTVSFIGASGVIFFGGWFLRYWLLKK